MSRYRLAVLSLLAGYLGACIADAEIRRRDHEQQISDFRAQVEQGTARSGFWV